ncbi:CRISPR-associated protein Csn1, partial [Klebsiella oxytoca]
MSADERKAIIPLFMRKSKKTFDFGDIAKALIKKSGHAQFNYPADLSVSGCPVTAALGSIFGSDWQRGIAEVYVDAKDKS